MAALGPLVGEMLGVERAPFDVEHEGRLTVRFPAKRYGTLRAYLALRPRQMHGRDELIDLIWP